MIDKLEWNLAENDSYKEENRSDDDTGNNSGEKVRDILQHWKQIKRLAILKKKKLALLKK